MTRQTRQGLGGCRGSVLGAHDPDRRGVCYWCGERVEPPVPAPPSYPRSELSESYAYFYDPDEATERYLIGRGEGS